MNPWRKDRPAIFGSVPAEIASAVRSRGKSPASGRSRPWKHVVLFVLTLFSMVAAGAMQQGANVFAGMAALPHLVEGIPFAATLLGVLTAHEFGHYFAARKWGVRASLPYFIPLPYFSFLGTLGAVIKIRSPIPNNRALLDIGAAGPLAGLVIALAACMIGLPQSTLVQERYFHWEPIQLGAPLIFRGLSALFLPGVVPDQMVLLSPVAFAGWVGLFITAFNLFPVGQLDGGHIVYALFGRRHRLIGRLTFAALLGLGLFNILSPLWGGLQGSPVWLALAFLLLFLGRDHPSTRDPGTPLDPRRRRLGYLCLVVFALCFTPVPFRF